MKRRLLIGTALAGVCAVLVMTVIVRAATVTLTKLPATYFDQPVGIDWQPTTNELLVSYNWPTGSPNTFERVNRVTGAAAPLGSVSGYTDEVYFATVRPGAGAQAAGWQVGDIYSGKGAGDFTHLARLGPAGNVINATFGNMPEALVPGVGTGGKLKRGGVEFDRFGVAGYDLIVVASNDNGVSPLGSVLYRISSAGVTVKLAEVPNVHLEGITTVPNDPATYGPFAGKILVGEEVGANIYVFDPNTSPNQNPVIVPVALPNGDPIKVEDLWIIPPNSAFYGVDCFNCDAGGSSKIWTAPSSEWTSYVGQLLVAQEYSAQLYLVKWNGSGFITTLINPAGNHNDLGPNHWEHITFAPDIKPEIDLVKKTNGTDNDSPTGPLVPVGSTVTWTYLVTNTGNEALINVTVKDDAGTPGVPGDDFFASCPKTTLAIGESMTCSASGVAKAGQYTNLGTANGTGSISGLPVSDTNPDNYFGTNPGVQIIKYTNGNDANDPNGTDVPFVPIGSTVTWTYKVTNTGNTSVPIANLSVTDNTTGVTPVFDSVLTGDADNIFEPGEVWQYKATGTALDLTQPPPAGTHTQANSCTNGNTQPAATAYINLGTATIPGATDDDPSSYCDFKEELTPCPAGSFVSGYNASGDLVMVYDQFPAPNDNSYGVNAVGWPKGHTFGNLTGSDKAGFQIKLGATIKLSINIDYLTAAAGTASGYKSLGPFGGDGSIVQNSVPALTNDPAKILYDTSLARDLNNLGYFAGGVQTVGKPATASCTAAMAAAGTCVVLTVDSPKTEDQVSDYDMVTPNPFNGSITYTENGRTVNGWDFHDTYFVTLKAAYLASIGCGTPSTCTGEPNLTVLHNSPAKPCPPDPNAPCSLAVSAKSASSKSVKATITNNGTEDVILNTLALSWPAANGKLVQVKLGGNVVYDTPDVDPPSVTLGTASNPLVTDLNKRTVSAGKGEVVELIFQNNVNTVLANYTGSATFAGGAGCTITILP